MKVSVLTEEQVYVLANSKHGPPVIHNQKDENLFQADIRAHYHDLVGALSALGKEGDFYGVSDFAVRPDLKDRPTVKAPPAYHAREFVITVLTRKFYDSAYLEVLIHFLCSKAPGYRIEVTKDFDPVWHLTLYLTVGAAQVFCTDPTELSRLERKLARL